MPREARLHDRSVPSRTVWNRAGGLLLALVAAALPTVATAPGRAGGEDASVAAPPPFASTGLAHAPSAAAPDVRPMAGGTASWWPMRTRAESGEATAACELSLQIEDCALADDVEAMVDTHIAMAARSGVDAALAAREIGELQASVEGLRRHCANLPAEIRAQAWRYLLAAAVAGHEASMYRFLVDPPLPPGADPDHAVALAAWHANAPLLLGSLLQRGSPEAVALAFRAVQGEVFVGTRPLQARDPAAMVRLGTALVALREDDSTSQVVLERAATELPEATVARLRQEGRALAGRLLHRVEQPAPAHRGECREGWPGMASAYAAYGW
jgi:hypothetical protein